MIYKLIFLLLISLNGFGQSQAVINANLQKQIDALKATDIKIIADSTFPINVGTLKNGVKGLTVIGIEGVVITQKWIDSINTALKEINIRLTSIELNQQQLFKNDQLETLARVNADNDLKASLKATDDLLAITNTTARYASRNTDTLKRRVDSLSLALIPINDSIKDLQTADKLTSAQLKLLGERCDALKLQIDNLKIPKGVQLTY